MTVEQTKKSVQLKGIFTYLMMILFAFAIMARVIHIQFYEGVELRKMGKSRSIEEMKIDALRGNIYSTNNSLLAVTIPKYEIRVDLISNKSAQFFNANVDELAEKLSKLFKDRSKASYKKLMIQARAEKDYYCLLKRNVTFRQLAELKTFPIFKLGRNKGGLIPIESNIRELPYKNLARRTIGIFNYEKGVYEVGLEGAFNDVLEGTQGTRVVQKIEGGVWMPIDPANDMKPENGNDLYTTIDIDIQDVTEYSLRKQLQAHDAENGCAIVMEVETGEIRAMANLSKDESGAYTETFNYAIGDASEPGSTFKIASMLVALEDGYVDLEDTVDTENGSTKFYGIPIKDAHKIGDGIITVREVIEESSNVGIAKIISKYYKKKPEKFINALYDIGFNQKLDIPIKGETDPYIKNPEDKSWSGISLPWIAYGYELKITPLQTLTFFNAIANNGKMVKPLFVREIKKGNSVVESFGPVVMNSKIASNSTLNKLRSMMEGVVERGTAKAIKSKHYAIAGKTGTAQIAQKNTGYNKTNYKASFCGYFPAEDPKYTCIVVINNPSSGAYYGSTIAAPVFKNISDYIYANHIEIRNEETERKINYNPILAYKQGAIEDYEILVDDMDLDQDIDDSQNFVVGIPEKGESKLAAKKISDKIIPKLKGMTAKDAVYLLEEMGLVVKIIGKGFVEEQSLPAGTKPVKGKVITLRLSASS
jgi:cell division protein FtsI (penicillin-binding protein 3)